MSVLRGLGSLASGVANGLATGQQIAIQRDEANWRNEQRDYQRDQMKRDESLRKDTDEANRAMMETLKGFESEAAKSSDPLNNYLRLGGTDTSMPDQSGIDSAPTRGKFVPNRQQLLAAAQARTNKLFELGRHDLAAQQWVKDEGLRSQMRKAAVQEGMSALQSTGDVTPLLKGVYSTIDDGYDLDGVEPVNNHDPKAPKAWDVRRRNSRTGEERVNRLTADQVDSLVQFAMDPVQAARYSLMEKLAGYRGDQQRQTNAERHEDRMEEIGKTQDGRIDLEKLRGASREQVARMNFDGRIRVAEIRGASGSRSGGSGGTGGNVARTVNLADGRVLLIMRNGDQRIASDDSGQPLTSLEYERLVGQTAGTVAKSLDGLTATPEANRKRASDMLPKPPARKTLGDAAQPQANRPSLSSFQKN